MSDEERGVGRRNGEREVRTPGIVIAGGRERHTPAPEPRIVAFIWGGKVRPTPTLPFGRWKGAA